MPLPKTGEKAWVGNPCYGRQPALKHLLVQFPDGRCGSGGTGKYSHARATSYPRHPLHAQWKRSIAGIIDARSHPIRVFAGTAQTPASLYSVPSVRYNRAVRNAPAGPAARPSPSELLKQIGLRRTPVRLGVLKVLADATQPLGVQQVLELLPEHTDTVTVYRTLNTYTNKKVVHRVRGEDRTWRYALGGGEAREQPHSHPHFVCETCGTVECLEQSQIPPAFVRSLKVADGYAVHYPEVTLHGVCPKCHE